MMITHCFDADYSVFSRRLQDLSPKGIRKGKARLDFPRHKDNIFERQMQILLELNLQSIACNPFSKLLENV